MSIYKSGCQCGVLVPKGTPRAIFFLFSKGEAAASPAFGRFLLPPPPAPGVGLEQDFPAIQKQISTNEPRLINLAAKKKVGKVPPPLHPYFGAKARKF